MQRTVAARCFVGGLRSTVADDGIAIGSAEGGKLVETWIPLRPLGTTWAGLAQERWTTPPPK